MTLRQWLDALRAELQTDVDLSADDQSALLELTAVAAHRSERIAAPLSAFLAGMVLANEDPQRRAERIRRLTTSLEGRSTP